jgi:hypothetical protein
MVVEAPETERMPRPMAGRPRYPAGPAVGVRRKEPPAMIE